MPSSNKFRCGSSSMKTNPKCILTWDQASTRRVPATSATALQPADTKKWCGASDFHPDILKIHNINILVRLLSTEKDPLQNKQLPDEADWIVWEGHGSLVTVWDSDWEFFSPAINSKCPMNAEEPHFEGSCLALGDTIGNKNQWFPDSGCDQ